MTSLDTTASSGAPITVGIPEDRFPDAISVPDRRTTPVPAIAAIAVMMSKTLTKVTNRITGAGTPKP